MAKYNKAHALSQYVSDLEEERKKRQRLQTSLDEHKQSNTTSNTTTVSTKPIAPIRTDTQYIANRILGGQTIEQRYAPFLNVQDRPTTSTDLFNKLKTENEEKLKQQNQNKETDWIDSLKDGYNFGDITKTVLGTVGFGEHSRNDKPIEVDTKAIENMYKNYTEEQLIKEQKNIQNKILTYSKNGAKSPKNKDGKYTLSGVLSMASNENNEKLMNDPEYITLNQIDDVLTEMIQNTRIKNKKYDKGFAGFAEKSTDVLVGGMAKGARGIEGTVKKIIGKEDTISEKTFSEKYSEKAMSEANGKIEKAALEMQSSIGQMVPQMIVPAGKASTIVGFANYGGSAYNEAKEQGYTEEQATRYGIVNGTLEMALNKVLPSFKVGGKNIYGKTATDNLTKKIMSKTIGNEAFKRWIIDASGEFTEEYLQEFLDPIVREALLEENNGVGIIKGKNASEIASNIANYTAKNFFSKENFHAGLLGALNSGLMGAPSAFQANAYTKATGRSSETGLTQNEQAVIDNIVENRVEELKKNKDKVTKKDISKIEQEVRQDLERGYIETSEIERALSNEEWAKHDKVVKQKKKIDKQISDLNKQISDLENKKTADYETLNDINEANKKLSELKAQRDSIDTTSIANELLTTREQLNAAMGEKLTDNDTLIEKAYGEELERKNAYRFDQNEKQTKYTKKINEDIKNLGIHNYIRTRDAIDIIKKVSNETGKQYRLVDNNSPETQAEYKKIVEKIAKIDNISMKEAFKKTENLLIDGFVSDGQVFINVESNNLMRSITGHETTHLFEGTKEYKKLQEIAFDYAKTKGEYDSRRASLEERYRGIEDANIENELTSDLVGDYLFSDIEFVRNLSTEQPNIFKKMYNYVKHLYNMATAGSKEARQLEQLKYNFEKVYRENNQSKASNNTKLMASNIEKNMDSEYNKNGIYIKDKSEYGSLRTTIRQFQASNPEFRGDTYIENGKYFYAFNSGEFDNYTIKMRIPIENNEELIDNIKEGIDNAINSNTKSVDTIINEIYTRRSNNSGDTVDTKDRKATRNNDRFYNSKQGQLDKTNDNGRKLQTNRELDSSFKIPTKDSQGRKLTKTQQLYFRNSKVRDSKGNLLEVYHGSPNTDINVFDTKLSGKNTQSGEYGLYFTDSKKFADDFSYERIETDSMFFDKKGKKGKVYPVYLNAKNVLDFSSLSKQEIESLYKYASDLGKLDGKETFVSNMLKWQEIGNHQLMKGNLDLKAIADNSGYDGIKAKLDVKGSDNEYIVFNSKQIKSVDNTSPSSSPDIRYSISVKEANTGTDNNGVKLSKEQQEYFKDSKATDENGNLITVYHTTTDKVAQFNEFNPVGTDYYKFGDQVVNYFTDDKNMSGSYADQHYKIADTKKITSMEEAKSLVTQMNAGLASENTIRIETKDKGYQLVNNIYKEAYEYAKSIWDNEITPEEKQIEKDYEELYKRYVESGYDNNLVPEFTSLENYAKDYAQKLDRITDNMTPEERDAFLSFRKPEFVSVKTEPVIIGEYNSKNELFRNLKQDIQKADSIKNKYQYEGYVNITNPYIIDAEGRTWNKVESKADSDITKELLKVNNEDRQYFERLASDSIHTYNENLFNYQQAERAINDFAVDRNNTTLEQRLIHRTIHDLGFEDFMKVLNNDKNVYWGRKEQFMDDAYNNGFATYKQKQDYQRTGNIPTEVLDKVNKLIHEPAKYEDRYLRKELEAMGMTPEIKETTIYDLWNNQDKAYKTFDEGGRYEYSKFNNEVNEKNLYRAIDNEILFKVAKKGFNDNNIRLLYNDWSVTNDIVKSIIELNKVGENYDGIIIKNVVDYGGESDVHEAHDLYITFNSNQFKAVDNTTPTDDPDIRYKLSNKNDIAPISNNDIRARDMLLPRQQEIQKAIAPIQEENKALKQEVKALQKEVRDIQENNAISYEEFEEYNKRIAPLLEEQEAPPEVEQVYDNLKDTTRMPKKELKLLSKNIKDTLGLTNKQKLDLEEIIQDYSTSETATREDLYNEIKQRYGKQAIITEYEDIRNVQRKIKSMKLDVSDNIRHDIADYNMLKQKNFGKLSFSRNGQPVDSVYQELSSEYPNYFPSNIYNETDQFLKIVDVANLENKSVEELNLDDNYIRETSDYIYESILDSKQDALQKATENAAKESLQGELKAPLPTVLDTSSIDANNVVDEVRLMEHKARKKSQVDKGNGKRAPFDWSTFEEVGRKLRAGEDANSIAELNKLDAEAANKQIEEQKKLKPKNESTLKKSLTYGQYLFTNRNVEIDNYAKKTGNHNIQVLADHINNIQGEITTNINNSQTDNNGNTIGKSITNIFSQADKAGLSEAFNDYLFHLSNIERHKWGKGSQVPGIDSSILIEEYEKTYPEMKKWAKEVNKYNKNLLYKQADAGLITKELADSLSEMYEFYVPFMENLEGEYTPDKTNSIKTRSTVKRAKGGASRNLLSFEDAMIRQTESAITQIRKNQLYQEIVKTKENANIDLESNTNPDIHDNGLFSDNGKYYLTAYVDGKATQVEIDKSLYHGLAQEGNQRIRQAEQKLSPITKPLQATSNIRRNILTTWNPSFMVTNMLKDIQDAPLNSKYASDMIKNYPKALKEISTGKGEHLEAFLNMYGQANLRGDYNLDSGLSDITKLAENNKNGKGMKFSKDLLKKIPQINEMIEMAPRYAEYLASIENGCSQMEALYNAREVTTNFGRGGIITKALNRNGFTFLNASVQGMSKLVRNFSGENGGRAVVGCIAKATALGIAPALLNALLFGDDDDYEALPDYIKDNYYLIKTSDKGFIRIPKGRMMSIFGSAARRTLEGIQGRENPYEGYLSNAYNQVGVQNPSESNIFAPLIQAKNNKTWYGTDLVPKRLQTNKEDGTKIPAKDQYDASTDKMSIWLGEKLNISPYKINYVIDQYSGGIGDIILPMMTEEAQSGSDSATGKMVAPLKDKFTADSITDNKYVTDFYSKLEELGEKKNATGSKKDEMSYNYMRNISFEMGSLYAEMRKVQADTTLKDSKKYAKVQNIKAEINRLAEEGMKGYKDVETYDNYARVGDRELYKYQSKDGKTGWSDSSGMYADDINNLGLSIKEKDTYYTTKMEMSNVANKFKEDEGAEKYRAVLKTIRNSKLPSDAKYELYNSWYGKSDETSSIVQGLGISANDYLKFKTADLSSTKNKNGYAVRGSKADKVISYLNKTKLSKGQKAVLYRLAFNYKGNYSSSRYSNAYNEEIVRYIDNSSLTYDESIDALKKLGFKVSKDGTVKWD